VNSETELAAGAGGPKAAPGPGQWNKEHVEKAPSCGLLPAFFAQSSASLMICSGERFPVIPIISMNETILTQTELRTRGKSCGTASMSPTSVVPPRHNMAAPRFQEVT
jgi:hypothetical protein